jgi:hypothetical protein
MSALTCQTSLEWSGAYSISSIYQVARSFGFLDPDSESGSLKDKLPTRNFLKFQKRAECSPLRLEASPRN